MHLISPQYKILGTSGIVGSHISNAVGFSYGQKLLCRKGITCVIFGDGATDAGTFYDSINIALLRKTPTLFVMENNNLAIRTPAKERQYETNFAKKVEAFGMKVTESGPDIKSMIRDIQFVRNRILESGMPEMIKVDTIRWYQHLGCEYELNQDYRDREIEKDILQADEINVFLNSLPLEKVNYLTSNFNQIIDSAWQNAQEMHYPKTSTMYDYVR